MQRVNTGRFGEYQLKQVLTLFGRDSKSYIFRKHISYY